jgi:hypothetical protein
LKDKNILLIGIFLLICSFFTFAAQITFEEKIFNDYFLDPFFIVGMEGSWGILISLMGLIIASFIPCP